MQPRLGQKIEVSGTVWYGEIISLWRLDDGSVEAMIRWSGETREWGIGGSTDNRIVQMSSLRWSEDRWIMRRG
jgi:hypothetical protein